MVDSSAIRIRAFAAADYDAAMELWQSIEGLGLTESDTREAVAAFLERNPGFSAVATAADGGIVGAVLCGHNGRAGALYHLAVALTSRPWHRPRPGRALLRQARRRAYPALQYLRVPRQRQRKSLLVARRLGRPHDLEGAAEAGGDGSVVV